MPQEEIRLKSPRIDVVKPIMRAIDQMINDGAAVELTEPQAVDVRDALEWVICKLANQKDYHRKRNYQMKEERELLEAALRGKGIDVDALKRTATNRASDRIVDESEGGE